MNDASLEISAAAQVVENYFQATYHGDMDAIRAVFHEAATIVGFIDDEFYVFSVDEFITRLSQYPSSAESKEKYDKRIVAVGLDKQIATVTTHNLVGDRYFTDKINVAFCDGKWKIIYKLFTNYLLRINLYLCIIICGAQEPTVFYVLAKRGRCQFLAPILQYLVRFGKE